LEFVETYVISAVNGPRTCSRQSRRWNSPFSQTKKTCHADQSDHI